MNFAAPAISVTPFLLIWARMTSISRLMTAWHRKRRSSAVMFSFTEYDAPYIPRCAKPER